MFPFWREPEPGVSQYRSHGIGAARMRRKLLKEKVRLEQRTTILRGICPEPEPTEIEKKLERSIRRIKFESTVKRLYLGVPIRGDGRDGGNFIVLVTIKPNKPTETIMSMQKNGFWGYTQSGRPTFVLPNSIAGKVTVLDVER
jgi:hypothetical protein